MKDNQLIVIANQAGLAEDKTKQLLVSFGQFFKEAQILANEAKKIIIVNEKQTDEMKRARELRLKIKEIRTKGVEPTRKKLKEQAIRENKAIDGISNVIKALIIPVEEHLEKQERFLEIKKAEKKEKQFQNRLAQISPYVEDVSFYAIREMVDEDFNKLVNDCKISYEANKRAEEEAEKQRIREEQDRLVEQKRIREENEKLRAEAEKKEKEFARERAKQEKQLEIERKKQAELEAKLRAEKEVQQKKAREAREEIEAEKKATEEVNRKKLLAPDKEKLFELALIIDKIQLPAVLSKEAGSVIRATQVMISKMTNYIREKAKTL